ncbi:hypothetical protein [Glutamicibacter sp.]|uniref:hypothetical protein n=1 Tax=Glutamicibacter sp. TaxID=1931995 RepID=UPI002FE3FF67
MPGRIARTKTAERVSELLGSREGRKHLRAHGWEEGMPVIMALPSEPLNDVMGLVSMHNRSVLVALLDAHIDTVKFLYLSAPNQALHCVEAEKDATQISDLFSRAESEGLVTFRSKYWDASSVAHPIPVFDPSPETKTYAQRFYA